MPTASQLIETNADFLRTKTIQPLDSLFNCHVIFHHAWHSAREQGAGCPDEFRRAHLAELNRLRDVVRGLPPDTDHALVCFDWWRSRLSDPRCADFGSAEAFWQYPFGSEELDRPASGFEVAERLLVGRVILETAAEHDRCLGRCDQLPRQLKLYDQFLTRQAANREWPAERQFFHRMLAEMSLRRGRGSNSDVVALRESDRPIFESLAAEFAIGTMSLQGMHERLWLLRESRRGAVRHIGLASYARCLEEHERLWTELDDEIASWNHPGISSNPVVPVREIVRFIKSCHMTTKELIQFERREVARALCCGHRRCRRGDAGR